MRKKLTKQEYRDVIRVNREMLTFADLSPGKIMLSLSGGDASAVAFHRARERWGDRVTGVFADTCSEDEDAYRIVDDCERLIGPVVRLKQYNDDGTSMDIWDCFDKHGIMRIPKAGNACKASVELKQKPLDAYSQGNGFTFRAIGYSFTEPERMQKLSVKKREVVLYPLVADPLLGECEIHDELRRIGIAPARIYEDGFTHNNCLAKGGCVLSGLAQFAAIKKHHPKSFEIAKVRSQAFFERTGFTVLRDQRGGKTTPYTLVDLERDIEAGRDFGNGWRSNCGCMSLFSSDELMQL